MGATALLLLGANTIAHATLIVLLALAKLLAPTDALLDSVRNGLARVAMSWISVNNLVLSLYPGTRWDIKVPGKLDKKGCYLVNCNHQSWVDIPVLQRCFNQKLPFLRFFLKSQLIWVPFLGAAWWALDFPFMKRISREKAKRKPGLKGKDLENARKACEKFRNIPVAMMNFPEGTRFTPAKHTAGKGDYQNLLVPRIGGIGMVLYALDEPLDGLVDVTIVYPGNGESSTAPTLWQLVSGQVPRIVVRAKLHDIPDSLRGKNFRTDSGYRRELESWVKQIWQEKDQLIGEIRQR